MHELMHSVTRVNLRSLVRTLAPSLIVALLLCGSTMAGKIPVPGTPVPITLQTFVLMTAALTLGWRRATAGTVLKVPAVAGPATARAARVVVDRSASVLRLLDDGGRVLAQYPASTGSEHDPLPIGDWSIVTVVENPTFHYNPDLFWDADPGHEKATLAAGPNNPVGTVWIDLSKPHYGIHGTPEPASVGKAQSHGCIRLTNWDAKAVAAAVDANVPVTLQE